MLLAGFGSKENERRKARGESRNQHPGRVKGPDRRCAFTLFFTPVALFRWEQRWGRRSPCQRSRPAALRPHRAPEAGPGLPLRLSENDGLYARNQLPN
jgi:hypothetical protein